MSGCDNLLGLFSLPGIKQIQTVIYSVQYRSLVKAPRRAYEDWPWRIAGQTVDGNMRRYQLKAFHHKGNIFFDGAERLVVSIQMLHLRAFDHIEKVKLHAEESGL